MTGRVQPSSLFFVVAVWVAMEVSSRRERRRKRRHKLPPELDKILANKSEALRRRIASLNQMLFEEVMVEEDEREEGDETISILDDITQQVEEEVERRLGREMQWTPSAQVLCGGERWVAASSSSCGGVMEGVGFLPCINKWSSSTVLPLLVTSGS